MLTVSQPNPVSCKAFARSRSVNLGRPVLCGIVRNGTTVHQTYSSQETYMRLHKICFHVVTLNAKESLVRAPLVQYSCHPLSIFLGALFEIRLCSSGVEFKQCRPFDFWCIWILIPVTFLIMPGKQKKETGINWRDSATKDMLLADLAAETLPIDKNVCSAAEEVWSYCKELIEFKNVPFRKKWAPNLFVPWSSGMRSSNFRSSDPSLPGMTTEDTFSVTLPPIGCSMTMCTKASSFNDFIGIPSDLTWVSGMGAHRVLSAYFSDGATVEIHQLLGEKMWGQED